MIGFLKSFFFENKNIRQTVAKNTFWLSVGNFGGRLLRASILVYAARVLTVEDWGAFSYAFSLIAFFTILADFGLNSVLIRESNKASGSPEHLSSIQSTVFYMKLVLLGIGVVVITLAAPWLTPIPAVKTILPLVAMVMAFDSLRDFGFALIRAKEKMEWESALYILTNFSIVAFGFAVLKYWPGLMTFTLAYTTGTMTGMLATLLVTRRNFGWAIRSFSASLVKPVLSAAWPIAIAGILAGLMLNTDVILIGYFLDSEQVGYYSAALRIIMLLYLIPQVLVLSVFPSLSRTASAQEEKEGRILEVLCAFLGMIALPILAGGAILARPIIELVFGPQYLPAVPAFSVLSLTIYFSFVGMLLTTALFARNDRRALIKYALLGGGTNLILDLILIPIFGILGSAMASFIVQGLTFTYSLYRNRKALNFSVAGRLKAVLPATLIMALLTWTLNGWGVPVIPNVAASGILYAGLLWLFRERLIEETALVFNRKAQDSL